jgi:MFS family permease
VPHSTQVADHEPLPSTSHAWWVVAVLTIANVCAFVDRQVLYLLVAPIRRDLGVGDTEMSLLLGIGFALFYTLLGIPLGRLADTRSRRVLVGAGIALWSAMTALSGLARSYTHLLLARIGVGIGEAALSPPSVSLLADLFPPRRLASALSVYSVGIYLGAGLANIIGGSVIELVSRGGTWSWPLVGEIRPWQSVFLVLGLAGLPVAALLFTVREPARVARTGAELPSLLPFLREQRAAFWTLSLGFACIAIVNNGTAAWLPTFLIRTWAWSPARAGVVLGTLTATLGVLGVLLGGRLADRWLAAGHRDARLRVGIVAALANIACGIAYTAAPTPAMAIAALAVFNVFAAFPFGAASAAVAELAPAALRGRVVAAYLFVLNLVGMGLGPTLVALCTDRVFGDDAALRWSLLVVTVGALLGAALLLLAARAPYRVARERALAPLAVTTTASTGTR